MTVRKIAVLGAGSIGTAFAVLFAAAGATVRIWDPLTEARERALSDVRTRLGLLHANGLLDEPPERALERISFSEEAVEAVAGASLVQECAPERAEVKRELFARVAAGVDDDTVLASSSSAIVPSSIAAGSDRAAQIVVGHPGNPPYLLPVIEVVPSPASRADIVAAAMAVYRDAGLSPVLVRQEAEGFIFNRLQGAVLREAYCLVRDGVASVEDVDTVMRRGLGRRWAFIGPFETADLNTRGGIASHAAKMGPAYERMGAERGQHDPWSPELVAEVAARRRESLPLDEWERRVAWRDEQLLRFRKAFDGPA
ncbi:3-hydroxyacyl-CoA dehydrogenase [Leucobacter weissii]|uniref:L-gulonate 3-dehydrogenase n=1 Tax=Leucobacter weissii TaxID=1983706 RepID=A0A939MIE9_9MICO|nr:3-hydroxyacyl-CoA dehydrogenase [Leucobacter weissii]